MRNYTCYGCVFDVEYLVSGLPGDEGKPGGDFEVKGEVYGKDKDIFQAISYVIRRMPGFACSGRC